MPRQVGRSVKNHQVLRTAGFPAWGGPGARGPDSEGAAPAESQEMAIAALWGMQGAPEAPVTTWWMLSKPETLSILREQPWAGVQAERACSALTRIRPLGVPRP